MCHSPFLPGLSSQEEKAAKARSARNAYTGSHWRQERELLKALRRTLREQREALRRI